MFSRSNRQLVYTLALSLVAGATAGPCDIYASGGTPCVAAHGTTRALYSAYDGPLYQLLRGSDQATTDVLPLAAGGVANAATQDSFCDGTTCLISIIYDQSGKGNHLTQAPPGGAATGPDVNGYDHLAAAGGAPVLLNGKRAFGVFIFPGSGYRNNNAVDTATGDEPEGMYAVLDSTHYNAACCFDYGNAETNTHDTGNGHMEAINFGSNGIDWGAGPGAGPWVMADLENGLFSSTNASAKNQNDPTQTSRFVTAIVKGNSGNQWAIRGGNAASGGLSTYYSGPRDTSGGYNPMSKEGAILLGVGGDNSDGGQGTFYEGVMTTGYPSDATENAVQANIVAAGYAASSLTSGPAFTVGSSVSFKITTACCTTRYIAHTGTGNNNQMNTQVVTSSSAQSLQRQASWIVHVGLGNAACYSFESVDSPNYYIRHYNSLLYVDEDDNSKQFAEDATFCPQSGRNGQGTSLRAWGYPTRWWRHYNALMYSASNGGLDTFDTTASWTDDVSFLLETGFAS